MPHPIDVAIVGAGPYGLSLAAHLNAAGIRFRIFGTPMATWRDHMPKGMCLKSEGFASNLSAPDPHSTLEAWSAANGKPYSAQKRPVPVEDFAAYAGWFARRHVPMLEDTMVTGIARAGGLFEIALATGERLAARRVVMAVGITWFKHMPDVLKELPGELASHSFDNLGGARFKDRDVIVLGAGASAIDSAIALHEGGARVRIVSRRSEIPFHAAPDNAEPTILDQLRRPDTGIGPGWRSFFCTNAPLLFHRLPQSLRLEITRRHLGPAPGWFTREKIEGRIPSLLGEHLTQARAVDGRVALAVENGNGRTRVLMADHVVAATGYRPDLKRLPFLDADLRERIAQVEGTPILRDNFECSVPGMYFLGLSAANSFGPLLRFMYGAEYAAPRLAGHLHRRIAAAFGTKKAA